MITEKSFFPYAGNLFAVINSNLRCKNADAHKNKVHIPNIADNGNKATLYKITHTNRFKGMRKKFITVERTSSGTYCALIFIIEGQKIPTINSKTRNPNNCNLPSNVIGPPLYPPEPNSNVLINTGMDNEHAEIKNTDCMYFSTLKSVLAINLEDMDEPIMHATIIVAKIIPCGISSPFGDNAGVHKNTNEYIDASNKDCIAPS